MKKLASRFFKCYCHPDFYTDIMGDLEELYQQNTQNKSRRFADWKFTIDVILLFRPSLMKTFGQNSIIYSSMFRNYLKISYRNLLRHKFYSFINITGLAIGLAAFLLINLYTGFERSYDTQFSDASQLYRLTTDEVTDGVLGVRDAMSWAPSGKLFKDEFTDVLDFTTTYQFRSNVVFKQNDNVRFENNIIAADSNYFKLFDYPMIQGNPLTALVEPYSIVLTESKAKSYFGDSDPLGKSIELLSGFNRPFKVTGVIPDLIGNTHYRFDIILSLKSIQSAIDNDGWNGFNYYTYLKLTKNPDFEYMKSRYADLVKTHISENTKLIFNLQPILDIHLYSDFTYEPQIHGSAEAVQFLTIIAFFVLMIGWINYVNLSTARAIDRAKEVGLRKVIGARKSQLVFQFLFESFLINLISAIAAITLAELSLPLFNSLINKTVAVHVWEAPYFMTMMILYFAIGTFLTGFYPAIVLSGFKPVVVLKGKFRNSKKGIVLRKALVVGQFAVSMILISGTFIVIQQVAYMRDKDKGFDMEHVVAFSRPSVPDGQEEIRDQKIKSLKEALTNHSSVISVGSTSNLPGGDGSDINSTSTQVQITGLTDPMAHTTYVQNIDDKFIETMNMTLLTGRNFDRKIATDTAAIIINESMMRRFGIKNPEEVINQTFRFGYSEYTDYKIIGILKDFNRTSLKLEVEPTVYSYRPEYSRSSVVKLSDANYLEGIQLIKNTWQDFFPNSPLAIEFLDERFERLYEEDRRFGSVFTAFAILAILVAILGLFGLSSFMAVQRTKEVGVRKVLGASIAEIIGIFYKEFATLIGLSALIGAPAVYWIMNNWLDNYAYRIDFPWILIVVSLAIVLVLALFTVGYQTYRVAAIDPGKTIRYE